MSATSDSDSEYNSSDAELQEAFAKGLLKPGLNSVVERRNKVHKNATVLINKKLNEIKLNLPWIEKLDMVNAPAPLAPELALQMQEQEVRRAKQLQGNKKLPQYESSADPVLNDFRRETMFHRQAQGAAIDGLARLKKLGIATIRPDDYFAEMAKSDTHMQKVRENLAKKRVIAQRSEKIRQLRQQRKVAKQMQVEATLKKHAEKRKLMEDVKKYRKGIRKDLDFLDDKKKPQGKGKGKAITRRINAKAQGKLNAKRAKYGFGGKKRDSKKNTRTSSADVSEYKRPDGPGKFKGGKSGRGGDANRQRLGKNRRVQMKAKRR